MWKVPKTWSKCGEIFYDEKEKGGFYICALCQESSPNESVQHFNGAYLFWSHIQKCHQLGLNMGPSTSPVTANTRRQLQKRSSLQAEESVTPKKQKMQDILVIDLDDDDDGDNDDKVADKAVHVFNERETVEELHFQENDITKTKNDLPDESLQNRSSCVNIEIESPDAKSCTVEEEPNILYDGDIINIDDDDDDESTVPFEIKKQPSTEELYKMKLEEVSANKTKNQEQDVSSGNSEAIKNEIVQKDGERDTDNCTLMNEKDNDTISANQCSSPEVQQPKSISEDHKQDKDQHTPETYDENSEPKTEHWKLESKENQNPFNTVSFADILKTLQTEHEKIHLKSQVQEPKANELVVNSKNLEVDLTHGYEDLFRKEKKLDLIGIYSLVYNDTIEISDDEEDNDSTRSEFETYGDNWDLPKCEESDMALKEHQNAATNHNDKKKRIDTLPTPAASPSDMAFTPPLPTTEPQQQLEASGGAYEGSSGVASKGATGGAYGVASVEASKGASADGSEGASGEALEEASEEASEGAVEGASTTKCMISCQICKKQYSTDLQLHYHYQIHMSELKYIHKNVEVADRLSFKCNICLKSTQTLKKMVTHIRRFHTVKPDSKFADCEICFKRILKVNLNQHMKTHSNSEKYECQHCKRQFKQVMARNRHVKKCHSNATANANAPVNALGAAPTYAPVITYAPAPANAREPPSTYTPAPTYAPASANAFGPSSTYISAPTYATATTFGPAPANAPGPSSTYTTAPTYTPESANTFGPSSTYTAASTYAPASTFGPASANAFGPSSPYTPASMYVPATNFGPASANAPGPLSTYTTASTHAPATTYGNRHATTQASASTQASAPSSVPGYATTHPFGPTPTYTQASTYIRAPSPRSTPTHATAATHVPPAMPTLGHVTADALAAMYTYVPPANTYVPANAQAAKPKPTQDTAFNRAPPPRSTHATASTHRSAHTTKLVHGPTSTYAPTTTNAPRHARAHATLSTHVPQRSPASGYANANAIGPSPTYADATTYAPATTYVRAPISAPRPTTTHAQGAAATYAPATNHAHASGTAPLPNSAATPEEIAHFFNIINNLTNSNAKL